MFACHNAASDWYFVGLAELAKWRKKSECGKTEE
jgi:hypothetical protein